MFQHEKFIIIIHIIPLIYYLKEKIISVDAENNFDKVPECFGNNKLGIGGD